jgi:type IV pilus assembly protein PilA
MTASTLRPQLRSALLRQIGAPATEKKNLLQKGFTLVELMIVIVIVGILSAVAIPNFMGQTEKAKATEAKSNIAATLKQAQALYVEDGQDPKVANADMLASYKTPEDGQTKFDYEGDWTSPIYTVTATGNSTDSSITDKVMRGCANFETGKVAFNSQLDEDNPPNCTAGSSPTTP